MTDVAVYGATGAGVAAAVAAHETGARTVLVEPDTHVGGMVSGGPGWTDADSVPLADAASQGRRESARARLPLRVHVAFGSVRMEPTLMLLGHAAGLAAAQAARRGVAVQDVEVEALQRELAEQGQVLAL